MYHLKRNPQKNHVLPCKNKIIIRSTPGVIDCLSLSRDTRVNVTLVARPLLTTVAQKLCRCEHGLLTSRTSVCCCLTRYFLVRISIGKCFTNSSKRFRCEVMFENEHTRTLRFYKRWGISWLLRVTSLWNLYFWPVSWHHWHCSEADVSRSIPFPPYFLGTS
jgi:hypothetical protein